MHRSETKTLRILSKTRPRQDISTSQDRLETETSRPRPHQNSACWNSVCQNRVCLPLWLMIDSICICLPFKLSTQLYKSIFSFCYSVCYLIFFMSRSFCNFITIFCRRMAHVSWSALRCLWNVSVCFVQKGLTARVETIAEGHVIIELVRNSNFSIGR